MRPLTHSCFVLLVLGRLFLLALPVLLGIRLLSLWSPSFPPHALVLISLFLVKMRLLLTLTLSPLMIWCSGQTALFLFLLAKAAPAYLPPIRVRALFPFQQAQYAQVSLLKSPPFCKLFHGLGSTNNFATSLFLLSDSRSVLSSIFPSTSDSLADQAGTVFSLLFFYQATMGPPTLVSPGERCG